MGAALNSNSKGWQYVRDTGGTVSTPTARDLPVGSYQPWILANDGYVTLAGPYDLKIVWQAAETCGDRQPLPLCCSPGCGAGTPRPQPCSPIRPLARPGG